METTKKLNELRVIDDKILDLQGQLLELERRRNALLVKDVDFVGKYYRISNFGSFYLHYIHVEDIRPKENGISVIGNSYTVLNDNNKEISIRYNKNGSFLYYLDPSICDDIFEEITKEEFISEIKDVFDVLGICINEI